MEEWPGHIKKFCRDLKAEKEHQKEDKKEKSHKATTVTTCEESDSKSLGLIASHALAVVSSNKDCTWSLHQLTKLKRIIGELVP